MNKAVRAVLASDSGLALAVLAWLAATAWARPLMLPDEGRYVGVAWEMMRSGDWLTPTLNALPYFHKPPLFYWITAASMSLFGTSEWAARAAPLLGAWIGALALYGFVRRWAGQRLAKFSLIALLAQPLFYGGAQFANLDMLVAGLITLTIVLFAHATLSAEAGQPYRRALAAAYVAAALAVLAKGLIGVVIPGLVIGAWWLVRRRWSALRMLLWWPGIALFVLVAAPWFVAMQLRFAEFFHYFFVVQHFQRFADKGFNNAEPFWFYFALLFVMSLPWLPWLVRLMTRGHLNDVRQSPTRLLMLLWLGVVILFFSWPQSKLVGYVMPAMPALAFLIADGYLTFASSSIWSRPTWAAGTGLGVALGLATVAWLSIHPLQSSRKVAAALVAQRSPSDPVVMLGAYVFDIPFYAKLGNPVQVVDDWADPEIRQGDNWRRELADAGDFYKLHAAPVLISKDSFKSLLCTAPTTWLISSEDSAALYVSMLKQAVLIKAAGRLKLWRVDRAALASGARPVCPRAPAGAASAL